MRMPPNVNPYDPRKSRLEQPGQQQQQPQQQAQPVAPVKSSLDKTPAGQPQQTAQVEKKKPAAPVTYQQQAGAVADPRFSQALAQKLQQDVAAKQAALQQQQAEFQQKLTEAGSGVAGAPTRINEILGKVKAGTATDAELAEFQSLQQAQYQGPTGLDGAANIAALSQLAASPALLAQQYAGFAPGGVSAGDFQRAMAGLQKSPQLAAAQEAATGLAQRATSAEEVAAQQAALLKGQTEAAKEAAETGSKAAEAEYTGQLSEAQKAETEAKTAALNRLKAGLFMGSTVTQADLQKLGLTREQVQDLRGLDVSQVEGIGAVNSVEDLNREVEKLKLKQQANQPLTPEQERLVSVYGELSGLKRDVDDASKYGYANKQDLAKINALRRIRGQAPLTEEEAAKVGAGAESGRISESRLASLKGVLSGQQGEYAGEAETEKSLAGKEQRLTGDNWYKGGLIAAQKDLNKLNILSNPTSDSAYSGLDIMEKMKKSMEKNKNTQNKLYGWIKENEHRLSRAAHNITNARTEKEKADAIAYVKQQFGNFKKQIDTTTKSYQDAVSGKKSTLAGMSDISRALNIE